MSYISKGLVYLENQMYSYLIMLQQLKALENQYPFLKVQMIGKSVMERPLYLIHLGNGKRKIHINGSHHANEWVTSFIVMKSVEKLCEEVRIGQVKLEQINFDFVPMVNPDGVELSLYGLQSIIYTKQKKNY